MRKFLKRNNLRISLFLSFVALFTVLLSQNDGFRFDNIFLTILQKTAYPFQKVARVSSQTVTDFWNNYIFLMNIREQNLLLKQENKKLITENVQLYETSRENLRLKELLKIEKTAPYRLSNAQVIYEGTSLYSKVLLINKGTDDGVKNNFAVIDSQGVIGKVLKALPKFSQVQLLIDAGASTPAILQNLRVKGFLQGTPDEKIMLRFIPFDVPTTKGERVITSGLAGIYPKGLNLGTVESIIKKEFNLFQTITIKPSVRFKKLEEVFVVLDSKKKEYKTLFTNQEE